MKVISLSDRALSGRHMNHELSMNRIHILKKIDALIGPFLVKLCHNKNRSKLPPDRIAHILVIRPGGLGDAALLLPSLKAVKQAAPTTQIDVLCENRNAGIFKATPYVDTVFYYDNPLQLLKLFAIRFDLIIDTEQSHFLSAVICSWLKSSYRIGFGTNGRNSFYDRALPYYQNRYEADSFWHLFREFFPIAKQPLLSPSFFFSNKQGISENLNTNGIKSPFVCLFPGATVKQRHWALSKWSLLVDHFDGEGYRVALLGGKAEIPVCNKILEKSRHGRAINLAGRLSILKTAWLLEQASLLISTDSGILHVGVLSGVPTISLFGSGISEKWGPKGPIHRIVNLKLPCSPCTLFGTTPPCPNEFACMKIPAHMVIDASRHLTE